MMLPRIAPTSHEPLNSREYASLLVLRDRIRAGLVGSDDLGCAAASEGWSDAIVIGTPVLAGTLLAALAHVALTGHLPGF